MNCNTTAHLEQMQFEALLDELNMLVRQCRFPQKVASHLYRFLENARQSHADPKILYPAYEGETFDSLYSSPNGSIILFTFNVEVLLDIIAKSNIAPVELSVPELVSCSDIFYDRTASYIPELSKNATPIIMLPFSDQHIVVDGNERLIARIRSGVPTIEAYFLGASEAMLALHSREAQYLYLFLLNLAKFSAKL